MEYLWSKCINFVCTCVIGALVCGRREGALVGATQASRKFEYLFSLKSLVLLNYIGASWVPGQVENSLA